MFSSHYHSIVPFGGPGVGKSTFCNMILDGKDSGRFKSSESTQGGETKKVSSFKGNALADQKNAKVKVFDVPGLTDPDLPIDLWVEEIRNGVEASQQIDMAIMILKATDYRMTMEQIISAKAMCKFLENLKPKSTFLCFTFCDKEMPKEKFVKEKLATIKKYCDLEVPAENVIFFKNTKQSLEDFITNFVKSPNTKFCEDL